MVEKAAAKTTNREMVNEVVRNCRLTHRSMMRLKQDYDICTEPVVALNSLAGLSFIAAGMMMRTIAFLVKTEKDIKSMFEEMREAAEESDED